MKIHQKGYINGWTLWRQKMRLDMKNCFDTENKNCDDVDQFGYHAAAADASGYDPVEDDLYNFAVDIDMVSVAGVL